MIRTDEGLAKALLDWFQVERRDLPWRRDRTPWRTWVSEVMLQQTTVDMVVPRFEAFMKEFPTPRALAAADDEQILAAWAGLGYYRRVRSLREGARYCVEAFDGEVPSTWAELLRLPGVGPYTAGAIASLAFGVPVPAIDGNVGRVASRLFGLKIDPSIPKGRAALESALTPLIPKDAAALFNEAMIELGALTCRPHAAECERCPLEGWCVATDGDPLDFPIKKARKASIAVRCVRALIVDDNQVWMTRIPSGQRLAGFNELPGRWLASGEPPESALVGVLDALGFSSIRVGEAVATCHHVITHHRIDVSVHTVDAKPPRANDDLLVRLDRSMLKGSNVTTETRKVAQQLLKDRR